jgi:hypothetical protein
MGLSAAAHADVRFAKTKPDGESDLAQYCEEKGIRYVTFKDPPGRYRSCRLWCEGAGRGEGAEAGFMRKI